MCSENYKTEAKIQQDIVMYVRNELRVGKIFSVPNESESKRDTINKKKTGLLSGVSDLIWIVPNETIYVEVKTLKGVQSPAQKRFELDVLSLGQKYWLVRSKDDFITMANFFVPAF